MRPAATGPRRRGIALVDAILGGVILGIGLAVTLSLASRAVAAGAEGQRRIVASWLLDELLGMVVADGPVDFPRLNATGGRFDHPFDDYEFAVALEDLGIGQPFRVTATVRWRSGRGYRQVEAQTYVSERRSDEPEVRAPPEPIDRYERWYPPQEE
jgi:hypothetical protein